MTTAQGRMRLILWLTPLETVNVEEGREIALMNSSVKLWIINELVFCFTHVCHPLKWKRGRCWRPWCLKLHWSKYLQFGWHWEQMWMQIEDPPCWWLSHCCRRNHGKKEIILIEIYNKYFYNIFNRTSTKLLPERNHSEWTEWRIFPLVERFQLHRHKHTNC